MAFGKRLREIRKKAGMTLEVLSKKSKTTKGYLSGIENEKIKPPLDQHVRKLAKILGEDEIEFLKLAYYDKLPVEIREACRDVLLPKPHMP
jgi:transcriptional regulator with XRE-family HTH domain